MARVVVAILMIVPVLPARADSLEGLTDTVDVAVDETTAVVDQTADGTTEAVDEVAGSTGTVLDEPVDDTTDLVDGLSDSVTTVVDETEDSLTGVVDETEDSVTGVVDETEDSVTGVVDDVDTETGEATTPSPGTTTRVDPSTDASSNTTVSGASGEEHEDFVSAMESDAPAVRTTFDGRSEGRRSLEALTVLSAAHGLSGSFESELVNVALVTDDSLYGRLVGWLTSVQSGVFGLLAGPLLAMEILFRALTSAGSGLVAPLSLLSAYLFRLIRQLRAVGRAPAV